MKCELERRIDHGKVKKEFKTTLVFCPLLARDSGHMGVVCANCCLRVQQIVETVNDLVLRHVLSKDDLRRDPIHLLAHLDYRLRAYAEVVGRLSGKTWLEIPSICRRCNATPVVPTELPTADATEITHVGIREV